MRTIKVAGAFIRKGDKFLIVKRGPNKHQPLTWALPSGKLEEGETPDEAIIREVFEETSITINKENLEYHYSKLYDFSEDGYNTEYNVFSASVPLDTISIIQPEEHIEHRWVTVEECLALENLIAGLEDVIKTVHKLD